MNNLPPGCTQAHIDRSNPMMGGDEQDVRDDARRLARRLANLAIEGAIEQLRRIVVGVEKAIEKEETK